MFGIRMEDCVGQEDPDCTFLFTKALCVDDGFQICVESIGQFQDTHSWTVSAPGLATPIYSSQSKFCVTLSLSVNTLVTFTHITTPTAGSPDTCIRTIRIDGCESNYCTFLDPDIAVDSCMHLSVEINNPTGIHYVWTFGDNTPPIQSDTDHLTHTYTSGGVFEVCIITANAPTQYYRTCCFNVNIDSCDCFDLSWSQCSTQAGEECCFEFTVSSIFAIDSIEWDFGDGKGKKWSYDTMVTRDFIGSGPYWVCANYHVGEESVSCCESVYLPPCECCMDADFSFQELESSQQYPPSCMKSKYKVIPSCNSPGMTVHYWFFSDGTVYTGSYPNHIPPDHFFTNFITEDGEICVTHKVYCDTILMDEVTHCKTITPGAYIGLPLATLKMSDYLSNQQMNVYQFINAYMNHSTVPLLIEGNLIVDINVSFGTGIWNMAEGSLITVNQGKNFHLNGTVLQTAARLGIPFINCCRWQGIQAYQQSSLEWTAAEIWDAYKALYLRGGTGSTRGAKIKMISCRFEENIDGIHFEQFHRMKIEAFHDNYMRGCWLINCGELKCGCGDGTAIIVDRNDHLQWMPSTGSVNEIENFNTAFKVTNASARLRNFDVHDIKYIGIDYTKDNSLKRDLNIDSIKFEHMPIAVLDKISGGASHTLTAVASDPLSSIWTNNVHKAFDINASRTKIFANIEHVHLHTDNGPENFGVKVHLSGTLNNEVFVSNNDIQTNGGDHTIGVSFTADAEGPQSGFITHNRILNNATNNGAGIFVHNWHGTRIQNDTITTNNPKPGIDISHSRQSVITCNRLLEGGNGLLFVDNQETTISDNLFYDNSNHCIETHGNCMGSLIRRNNFNLSTSSSNWYSDGSFTGKQLHSQYNSWNGQNNNSSLNGEIKYARPTNPLRLECQFLAPSGTTEGSQHHPYRTPGMIVATGPTMSSQTIVCNAGPVMLQSDTATAYGYAAILADSASLDSLPEAILTALYQSIFAEILQYPHWTSLSDTLSDFYDALENEYVGESAVLNTDIHSFLMEIEVQQIVFDSFDVLHSGVVDSMIIVEELIEVESDLDTLALYEILLDSLQAQLADLEEEIGNYRYLCDSLNAEAIEALEVSNNSLDPQNDAEEYDQWVTEQRLKLLNGTALDSTAVAELMVLAAMCRDSAGIAVNYSRGFTLALIDKYIPLFNCEEEEFGGQQLGLKQFIPVGIYPNPSTGIVLIDCDINAEIIQNVRISDLYGRYQIHRPILNKHGSVGLDFSSMSTGIYIVEMLDGKGKTLSSQRLIIHK
ncbi:MAG: T9SS type A sorting domain-containing protein [Saprospiraceae bacterium]|nr:T9SS type A sorting domain-containing protein [Candidatus Vicinibacter proximus]